MRFLALAIVLVLAAACGDAAPADSPSRSPTAIAVATGTPAATTAPTVTPPAATTMPLHNSLYLLFEERSLAMGSVHLGAERTQRIVLKNQAATPVTGVRLTIDGRGGAGFSIAKTDVACSAGMIPARTSCEISIRFAPVGETVVGPATMRAVGFNDHLQPLEATVTLTGSGTAWIEHDVPEYTAIVGGSAAITVDGTTTYIHALTPLEDALAGEDASAYDRSGSDGKRWGQSLLLEGTSARVAGAGSYVYLVMDAYRCGGTGFMRNADHGRRKAWSPVQCLTRNLDLHSMNAPEVAATGSSVFVAGVVPRPKRVLLLVSRNHGSTWRSIPLGRARDGEARVAASGRMAVVAWPDRDTVWATVSTDGGRTWRAAVRSPREESARPPCAMGGSCWAASASGANGGSACRTTARPGAR